MEHPCRKTSEKTPALIRGHLSIKCCDHRPERALVSSWVGCLRGPDPRSLESRAPFRPLSPDSYSRRQPYVTLSLLSTANANALPATSGARGTACYRRSVGIVSLVVGLPFAPCLREWTFQIFFFRINIIQKPFL